MVLAQAQDAQAEPQASHRSLAREARRRDTLVVVLTLSAGRLSPKQFDLRSTGKPQRRHGEVAMHEVQTATVTTKVPR